MINIIIIIIIWSLNIPIIRQELTVQSRALQCCTALFITALWNYITTPALLQTIADAVHLTISPCEVERTPGRVNSSQRAAAHSSSESLFFLSWHRCISLFWQHHTEQETAHRTNQNNAILWRCTALISRHSRCLDPLQISGYLWHECGKNTNQ